MSSNLWEPFDLDIIINSVETQYMVVYYDYRIQTIFYIAAPQNTLDKEMNSL